jgi:hypothetical protein
LNVLRILVILVTAMAVLMGVPQLGAAQTCLHRNNETSAERQRRLDALTAVRSINFAEHSARRAGAYRRLTELSPFLAAHRSDGGRLGDVARRLRLDQDEVLPGWEAHLLLDTDTYILTLRDMNDPCGFTYTTDESDVILQGYPVGRNTGFTAAPSKPGPLQYRDR